MSTTKSKPSAATEEQQSSFSTGFFLGVLSGAVGMYLLSSDRGGDLLEHLKKELGPYWDEAQQIPEVKEVLDKVQATRTLIAGEVAEAREAVSEEIHAQSGNGTHAMKFPKFKKHS